MDDDLNPEIPDDDITVKVIEYDPERKRVLLKTFLFFISIFLVFLMIKVLIKMRDNFIY